MAGSIFEAKDMTKGQEAKAKETIPMNRVGELGEIAGVVAFVASEENSFTTGQCYDATGGLGA